MKVRCIDNYGSDLVAGQVYEVMKDDSYWYFINIDGKEFTYLKHRFEVVEDEGENATELKPISINTESHYKGTNSLYKFAKEWKLNAYEFDIIKRIVRCRHKGSFEDDLRKTKNVIDIYLKEYESKVGS